MKTFTLKTTSAAACLFASLIMNPAWAAEPVGQIKTLSGSAFIEHEGAKLDAHIGDPVFEDDHLITGPNGSIGVTFRDNMTLSVGAASDLTIDEFVYDPTADDASFVATLSQGLVSVVSGDIARMDPDHARIQTTTSTIGIRGTRFVVRAGGEE